MPQVDLSLYRNPPDLDKGRGILIRSAWHLVNALVLQNPLNVSSSVKCIALKLFGAKIGVGVIFKTGISVKSPWNLEIGDHSWIGERVWIDSLAQVKIGNHVCVSQSVYFCCGNHDWTDPAFGKSIHPIIVEDGVWVASRATLLPGIILGTHSVVAAGSVVSKSTEPFMIYSGNPAGLIKPRIIK